ncbi:MAG: NlpC/P60 family protein [Paludibacter sp.]|jgi:hypothetical protein|nr:C40 family peptidase [Paludibacter sp.]HOS44995.1 C40 family peptidase [Paludibacter sp.]HPM09168.1 C40 family peptidase [Paludibacter sp.]
MHYGFVKLPLVPVRAADNERSEMTTQLLFGEYVKIIDEQEKWLYIKNIRDGYQGWADRKMITGVPESIFLKSKQMKVTKVCTPYALIHNQVLNQSMLIPGGSLLYDLQANVFKLYGETWTLMDINCALNSFNQTSDENTSRELLINTAMSYINVPYLWGGKSVLGIDCSGLVQTVYSIAGFSLPRDASQQAQHGTLVESLSDAVIGDLAFFGDTKGKITHVGILKNNTEVIHASGWVKVDRIDEYGIISSITGEYTHKLQTISRISSLEE